MGTKLTAQDVRAIRQRLADGDKQWAIALDYGLTTTTVSSIRTGKTWKNVPGAETPLPRSRPRPELSRLTPEQVVEIRRRLACGETAASIGLELGLGSSTLSRIKTGKSWKCLPGAMPARRWTSSGDPVRVCSKCNIEKPATSFKPAVNTTKKWRGLSSWCLDCFAGYMASYRQRPAAKVANMARMKARARHPQYRDIHRRYHRKWAMSPRGRAYTAAYIRVYNQRPDVKLSARMRMHKRRLRVKAGDLTTAQWHAALDAWGYRCAYCAAHANDLGGLTMDHVLAISAGGSHSISNVVPACKSCNCRKNSAPLAVALTRMGIDHTKWAESWARADAALRQRREIPIQENL